MWQIPARQVAMVVFATFPMVGSEPQTTSGMAMKVANSLQEQFVS
jgi:hypothetical protein